MHAYPLERDEAEQVLRMIHFAEGADEASEEVFALREALKQYFGFESNTPWMKDEPEPEPAPESEVVVAPPAERPLPVLQTTVFAVGNKVLTRRVTDPSTDWTAVAVAGRKWNVVGTVTQVHDAHGESYTVKHFDGTVGCYEPRELVRMG